MISEIFVLIKKDIKRLTRSKGSALVILIGPLLLMLLLGIAFSNSGLYGIKVGFYSAEYNDAAKGMIDKVEEFDFKVIKEVSEEKCISDVKESHTHICLVFANESSPQKKVEFYVDYSKLNLVYTLINILSYGVSDQSMQISMGITQDILDTLKGTSITLKDNAEIIREIEENAWSMGVRLSAIQEEVRFIGVDAEFESGDTTEILEEISDTEEEMDSAHEENVKSIEYYSVELEEADNEITDIINEIEGIKRDMESTKSNLTEVYKKRGCVSREQIFDSWDSDEINTRLSKASDPTCALLFSIIDLTDKDLEPVNNALGRLISTQETIRQARRDLEDMRESEESSYRTMRSRTREMASFLSKLQLTLDDAEAEIGSINAKKDVLEQELQAMQILSAAGVNNLGKLDQGLVSITDSLDTLTLTTPEDVIKPIVSEIKPILKEKEKLDYFFPSLIVMVITFIGLLLSGTIIMKEKSSPAYFRNFLTPNSNALFIVGIYLTSLAIVVLESLVLFIVAGLFFKINVFQNIGAVLIAISLSSSVFVFMGMILGYLLKSEETTTLAAVCLGCSLLFFSSMVIPLEGMKSTIGSIASASPFVLAEKALRQLIIYQFSLSYIQNELLYLGIYFAVLVGVVFIARNASKQSIE